MARFKFKELFIHNDEINQRIIDEMDVQIFFVWDLNEGLYVGHEFPGIDFIPIAHIPEHMIIQLKDDNTNKNALLTVVYGDHDRSDYECLYNKIANFLSRCDNSNNFKFKYEKDIENEHYEYVLEIEAILKWLIQENIK